MVIYLHFIEPRRIVVPISMGAFIGREGFDVIVKTESGSHIVGSDITVSRSHARIFYYKGKYYIQDLGSLNGTRINGELISGWVPRKQSLEAELSEGAVVEVGTQTTFRVEFEEEVEEISIRKDNCSILLLLKTYLLEALNRIHEVRGGRSESLSSLRANLEYVVNKKIFIEVLERSYENASNTIKHHISVMKSDPYVYQSSSELLNGLKEAIENVIYNVGREYEACTQL